MRKEGKTNISINLVINEVPKVLGVNKVTEKPETRHVLLNLDAVIMDEVKTKEEEFQVPTSLETLKHIQKLFISKSAEPWLQKYAVETPFHHLIFQGSSDETCPCGSREWKKKTVYLLNSKKTGVLNITFGPSDYLSGSHERSFNLFIPQTNVENSNEDKDEWTRLGLVKLQEVAGCFYINSLVNSVETIHLCGRIKPPDSLKIISENEETVAIIDLQRTSKLFQFIGSYMLTFTKKDLSFHTRALIVAAIICYDIGFHRRRESIKSILQYLLWLSFLLAAAYLLFLLLQSI